MDQSEFRIGFWDHIIEKRMWKATNSFLNWTENFNGNVIDVFESYQWICMHLCECMGVWVSSEYV